MRLLVVAVLGAGMAVGGAPSVAQAGLPVDVVALVRRAVQLRAQEEKHHRPVKYVLRKRDGNHETTKEIVETEDGDVARLIAINGRPLDAEQERGEMNRLDALAANPDLQIRRRRSEEHDAARVDQVVAMLPDSETYTLQGTVPCGMGQCYRISFVPNPAFTPPNLEAEVLKGFAGEVWIDQAENRLVRLDAHLVREVNIGFGILGRLDKGGRIVLQQAFEPSVGEWQPTELRMNLTGRALMVKTVDIQIDEIASDFSLVPEGLEYHDGIAMLKRPGTFAAQP